MVWRSATARQVYFRQIKLTALTILVNLRNGVVQVLFERGTCTRYEANLRILLPDEEHLDKANAKVKRSIEGEAT